MADTVGTPSENENDLLDLSDHKQRKFRLSCQSEMSDALDGLRVIVTPED